MKTGRVLTTLLLLYFPVAICQADSDRPRHPEAAKLHYMDVDRLLGVIERKSANIADSLRRQPELREELGGDAYHEALTHLAAFVRSRDRECVTAAKILGDETPRVTALSEAIKIDGNAEDWKTAIPHPLQTRWGVATEDRAREVWENGVAAVVQKNHLLAMFGIANVKTFDWSDSRIWLKMDCAGGPEWDVELYIKVVNSKCQGEAVFLRNGYFSGQPSCDVSIGKIAFADVMEISLDTTAFVPEKANKPIWTAYANIRTHQNGTKYYPRTRTIPIFNENAKSGIMADSGTRMLMLLAADVGLTTDDRTAAAIAITSSTIYESSNEEVRKQLRKDNADHLRFARSLISWQKQIKTSYRLDKYPLEAQLAWANRCIWLNVKYLGWNRTRNMLGDLDNYKWSYIPIETLKELNRIAVQGGLVQRTSRDTAQNIDKWISRHLERRMYWGDVLKGLEKYRDDPERRRKFDEAYYKIKPLRDSGETRAAWFKEEAIHQVLASNTETYLKLIKEHGCFYGACPDEAWIGQDLLRSVGLAPIAFGVSPVDPDLTGHCWAGYFNPSNRRWHSAQPGRSGKHSWYFGVDRIAIYPYAAFAARAGDYLKNLPFPAYFKQIAIGKDVKKTTQGGIATKDIRLWMLTPWVIQ